MRSMSTLTADIVEVEEAIRQRLAQIAPLAAVQFDRAGCNINRDAGLQKWMKELAHANAKLLAAVESLTNIRET